MSINKDLVQQILTLCKPLKPISTGQEECLHPLPGIRAVLFDIYGTLFISGSGDIGTSTALNRTEALSKALKHNNFKCSTTCVNRAGALLVKAVKEFHTLRKKNGVTHPEIEIRQILKGVLNILINEGEIKGSISPENIERIALDYEFRINSVWPMPGLETVLNTLKQKVVIGLISNAQFYTPMLFPAFFGQSYQELGFFDPACIWSYKILEAKPSKTLFAKALEGLMAFSGISPAQVLFVGNDKLNDILPALESGCKTALFAGDKRSFRLRKDDSRCNGVTPDITITCLSRIPELIL